MEMEIDVRVQAYKQWQGLWDKIQFLYQYTWPFWKGTSADLESLNWKIVLDEQI